ncbi:MAG: hypothetical protein HQL01_05400 [Nitrospirae bacterium]|nr:hypothetical protein [Nitrospirota bacterium]
MNTLYTEMMTPLLGMALFISAQFIVFRLSPSVGLFTSVIVGYFSGLSLVVAIQLYCLLNSSIEVIDCAAYFAVNVVAYSSMGYGFFVYVCLGETAIRIRMLVELNASANGLSKEEIMQLYGKEKMLAIRLNRLTKGGQLIFKDGRYFIGNRFLLFVSKLIIILKLIILGKKSEFNETS